MTTRPFLNSDPPSLARVWNSLPPAPLRLQPITPRLLDDYPLAKLYFEPQGLFVVEEEGRVRGFAHAGFASSDLGDDLDRARGCVSVLAVESHPRSSAWCAELLGCCDDYLRANGARSVVAGGPGPVDPFYLGLYGGSRGEGILSEDDWAVRAFQEAGYRETARRVVLQRELHDFRPPVERALTQWQRSSQVERIVDLSSRSFFDAGTLGQHERWLFQLSTRPPAARKARIEWWDVQPLADSRGDRMAGWLSCECDANAWTDGLGKFLIAESLRRLREAGITRVEVQVGADELAVAATLASLGFSPVTEKLLLIKEI